MIRRLWFYRWLWRRVDRGIYASMSRTERQVCRVFDVPPRYVKGHPMTGPN